MILLLHFHFEYIDVSVKDYLKWSNTQKSGHKLVRSKILEFCNKKQAEISLDALELINL